MISVIIPTLNEAGLLPATLQRIQENSAPHEVLVVDAASVDDTAALARSAGCRAIESSRRQRAAQMNLGAQQAKGNIFLFLHADTWIESNALGQVEKALDDTRVLGGGFARRFAGASRLLTLTCWLAEYRSRWLGWFLGDQGIFVRRGAFESLGGFRDVQLFEDLDFSRRLARLGRMVTLQPPVVSSVRRFTGGGALATTLTDSWLTLRYLCGADPDRLAAGLRRQSESLADRTDFSESHR